MAELEQKWRKRILPSEVHLLGRSDEEEKGNYVASPI